jgi:hypothetical protein
VPITDCCCKCIRAGAGAAKRFWSLRLGPSTLYQQ